MHRGNVRAIATYQTQSGQRRIFDCRMCGEQFSETRDTVFFDLRTPEEKVILVLKLLLCKVELTSLSFALGVTEETVLEWLRRAAEKAAEINHHLLREVSVTQVQLDEMWSFIARKHATQATEDGESTDASSDGRQWVGVSFAPEFRLLLAAYVGPRTYLSAVRLIEMTAAVVLGVPCFFSDGFGCYLRALIAVYHQLKEFARTGKRGRPRKPVLEPHPELVYAQLVKKKRHGRLQSLTERVCCGATRCAALGLKISTSGAS
jgi:transposase-like protein